MSPLVTKVAMNQPQTRMYMEVLQQSRASVPLREQNRPGRRSDTSESLSGAVGPVRAGCVVITTGVQRHDGGGMCVVA